MSKRILLLTLIANVFFSVAYAMEPEENPEQLHPHCPKSKEGKSKPCDEKDQENLAIKDLYWMLNGKLDESIEKSKARFYEKCAKRLVVYTGASPEDDPNCGLPQEIAQPFLELCRQLTKRLKSKVHQNCVIQAAASLNKAEVAILLKRKGNSNNPYLSMWHCLVSETMPDQSHYKVIPLLPRIQESNIDELLRINVLLGEMNGAQLFELATIFTTLSGENHLCRVGNCQRIFKKRPNMSVKEKLNFLQKLSQVKAEDLETFFEAAKTADFNTEIAIGAEKFHWVE